MSHAIEYGRALFLLTEECGTSERVSEDFRTLIAALSENPDYTRLLDTPAVATAKKLGLIDEAFSSLDGHLLNLVKLLAEKRLAHLLGEVAKVFFAEYDASRGIERVEAVSARPLSEEQTAALTARLEKMTGKTIIVKNTVDPSILGGMKLRYMGKQLDGSLKSRLDAFEKNLQSLVI